MRHVGELFKIVMDVTGGRKGVEDGRWCVVVCAVCLVGAGGCGGIENLKFHAKSGGRQKQQTCTLRRRHFKSGPRRMVSMGKRGEVQDPAMKLLCISIIHLSTSLSRRRPMTKQPSRKAAQVDRLGTTTILYLVLQPVPSPFLPCERINIRPQCDMFFVEFGWE